MRGTGPGKTNNPRGRPPGRQNKLALENIEAARSSGDTRLPHEILLSFARGEPFIQRTMNPITKEVVEQTVFPDSGMRLTAATNAAPYFAPKLAQVQHKGSIARAADAVSDDELIKVALPIDDPPE